MATTSSVTSVMATDVGRFVMRVSQTAKHGNTDVKLWRSYSRDIVDNIQSLDYKQAVQLLGTYSYMRYRHKGAMDALAAKVSESCYKLSSSEIAKVLRSFSVLEHRNDFLFRLMLPEISKRLDLFRIGDLASVFYSYSNMGLYNRHMVSYVESAVMQNLHDVRPRDLSQLMCALGKLQHRYRRLETVLGCHFCKCIEVCSYPEFGLIVNAIARLDFCGHPHLFSVVETEIYRKIKHFPSHVFALVANAVSRSLDSTKVVAFMAKEATGRLKDFDIHSMCLLSSSFSRRGEVRDELFDRMADRVGRVSVGLYPRAVASLSFAYGRAGHLHGPLMLFSGNHLEKFPEHYSCNEAAMVLRAHNLLNIKNESMLSTIAKFICDTYPDLVPIEAVDTMRLQRLSAYMELPCVEVDAETEACHVHGGRSRTGYQDDEEDIKHINHLEVLQKDPFNTDSFGKNFLERGLMHSLLWIVQSFAQHGVWNDREIKGALQRIANEVACRIHDLTPLVVSNMLYAYSRLGYRIESLVNLLVREIEDPRRHFVFEQDHLRLMYDALLTFGMDPTTSGLYRIPTVELKRLMEVNANDIEKVVKAILRHEYENSEEADIENSLEIKVPYADHAGKAGGTTESSLTYVHIPLCVGVATGNDRSTSAFTEQLKYNFDI